MPRFQLGVLVTACASLAACSNHPSAGRLDSGALPPVSAEVGNETPVAPVEPSFALETGAPSKGRDPDASDTGAAGCDMPLAQDLGRQAELDAVAIDLAPRTGAARDTGWPVDFAGLDGGDCSADGAGDGAPPSLPEAGADHDGPAAPALDADALDGAESVDAGAMELGTSAERLDGGSAADADASADVGTPAPGDAQRIWVYVLAGQSNMVGLGYNTEIPHDQAALVPQASIYLNDGQHPNRHSGRWSPLGPGFGVADDRFGPELTFGARMHELFPKRRLAIIKVAEGGSSLYGRWKPGTGDLYQLLLSETRTQLAVLSLQGAPQLAGFVWMQGESDAAIPVTALAYGQNLTQLVQALRTDLDNQFLPVVAGLISKDPTWVLADEVRDATSLVSTQLGRMEVVETDDLPRFANESVHYSSAGNLALGRRFADAIAAMQTTHWQFPGNFSTTQGDFCWTYRDRSGSTVVALPFDATSASWTGSTPGLGIGDGWMSPGSAHLAELGWWVPFAGDVKIVVRTAVQSPGGDGVGIEIVDQAGTPLLTAGAGYPTAIWQSFTTSVQQGSEIGFRTSAGPTQDPSADRTEWSIDITMTRVDE